LYYSKGKALHFWMFTWPLEGSRQRHKFLQLFSGTDVERSSTRLAAIGWRYLSRPYGRASRRCLRWCGQTPFQLWANAAPETTASLPV